ncbi:glycerate kinase [Candidatus Bathyarchaeota archaeon]|nr:glycerate kinase [Candidatus Bathyarchaeota archaeon]
MAIKNAQRLRLNGSTPKLRRLREDAVEILEAALKAADPYRAVERALTLEGDGLKVGSHTLTLKAYRRILVIGGGKASGRMAEALEQILGNLIDGGVVIVPRGTETDLRLKRIKALGSSHPLPDEEGVKAVGEMLNLLEDVDEETLILAVISGGGSALMTYPAEGVSLEELREITSKLMLAGARINELNAVRKHLSAIKGGRLAAKAQPATIVSLILSDVVGDPLDTIASGPTAPDSTTYRDAVEALKRYGLWTEAPSSVRRRLEAGLRGEVDETPKPGDPLFTRVLNVVVANNYTAASAALSRAESLGYRALLLSTRVEGEARVIGGLYASIAQEIFSTGHPLKPPAAIIAGGETTVTVRGPGRGGRNQELALASALWLRGLNALVASMATDGVDGPTDAAGALADGMTVERAEALGIDPLQHLNRNDSYNFFKPLGDLIETGPTGTNVNDIAIILVR